MAKTNKKNKVVSTKSTTTKSVKTVKSPKYKNSIPSESIKEISVAESNSKPKKKGQTATSNVIGKMQFKEVIIGKQIWSSENLNVEHFKNGDLIVNAKSITEWKKAADSSTPSWCYYDFNESNGAKFGKLYNWHAVVDERGIAPEGWRVPSVKDYRRLFEHVRGTGPNAIEILKSTHGWSSDLNEERNWINGSDEFSFCALPSGMINEQGESQHVNRRAFFWTSESDATYTAHALDAIRITYPDQFDNSNSVLFTGERKSAGLSLRLIKEKEKYKYKFVESATDTGTNFLIENLNTGSKFIVAEKDFEGRLDYENAIKACESLGNGYRLPTIEECEAICVLLHKNQRGELKDDWDYWTSEISDSNPDVVLPFSFNRCKDSDFDPFDGFYFDKYYQMNVRAVKTVDK